MADEVPTGKQTPAPKSTHIPLWQVLVEESVALQRMSAADGRDVAKIAEPGGVDAEAAALRKAYELMHVARSVEGKAPYSSALCFSGGGIRSATFNLGILQSLAEADLLGKFDYLSTVSGGGYVGAWFSSWAMREDRGVQGVIEKLKNKGATATEPEPPPLRHLRAYSKYLSPRLGLLSADSWTLASIYLRNLFLNWVVFLPLVLAVLMIPRICTAVVNGFPVFYPDTTKPKVTQVAHGAALAAQNAMTGDPKAQHDHHPTSGAATTSKHDKRDDNVHRVEDRDKGHGTAPQWLVALLIYLGGLLTAWAFCYAAWHQPSAKHVDSGKTPDSNGTGARAESVRRPGDQGYVIKWFLGPMVLAATCVATGWGWSEAESRGQFLSFVTFGVLVGIAASAIRVFSPSVAGNRFKEFLAIAAGGFFAGVGLWLSASILSYVPQSHLRAHPDWKDIAADGWEIALYVCLAAPLYLLSFTIGGKFYVGLSSKLASNRKDEDREWWARAGAWILIALVGWIAVSVLVLFGPILLIRSDAWIRAWVLSVGGVSGAVTLLLGKSGLTAARRGGKESNAASPVVNLLMVLAPPLFICFLIVCLSFATDSLLGNSLWRPGHDWTHHPETVFDLKHKKSNEIPADQFHYALLEAFGDAQAAETDLQRWLVNPEGKLPPEHTGVFWWVVERVARNPGLTEFPDRITTLDRHGNVVSVKAVADKMVAWQWGAVLLTLAWAFGLWGASWLMSRGIDLNKFSMHGMYRNRLIRAYLGASRDKACKGGARDPNPFTGFDPNDNVPMKDLWPDASGERKVRGPMHVVNITLNLVSGQNLAWQERKAESFTVSPLHAGSARLGYRNSADYTGGDGVTLGTSIAVSGAAVSPNMGYASSPAVGFLLAVFNIRLGWWWGNPGPYGQDLTRSDKDDRQPYRRNSPPDGARQFIYEALGLTDDTHPYVYLSDGGHFENLGLYEMVRRRCHHIIASDAGQDEKFAFEDLGNAIRKIYIDMGVRISFTGAIRIFPRNPVPKKKRRGYYCAIATIDYGIDGSGALPGELVYIKPAFYGDEPADIYNYAKGCETFPHETTADQFFTEPQFESYRNLGHYIGNSLFQGAAGGYPSCVAGARACLELPFVDSLTPGLAFTSRSGTAALLGNFPASPGTVRVYFGTQLATFRAYPPFPATQLEVDVPAQPGSNSVSVSIRYYDAKGNETTRHTIFG